MIGKNIAIAALILGFFALALVPVIVYVVTAPPDKPGPGEVFEQHLAALDAGDYALAEALMDEEECPGTLAESAPRAQEMLNRFGYTFVSAFRVRDVWLHEDGEYALIELDTPKNLALPGIAFMRKIDGEWRLTCRSLR